MLTLFKNHRSFILSAAFILTLLTGCLVRHPNNRLRTPEAPHKIGSLQLAWSTDKAESIVISWAQRDLRDTALRSITLDYGFIVGYTLLLACLVLTTNTADKLTRGTRLFLWLCVLAGVADVVENLFLTPYIQDGHISPFLFFIPATVKWALLAAVVLYIVIAHLRWLFRDGHWRMLLSRLWAFLRELLPILWLYLAGIILVLVGYFLFIRVSPGRDVVIQIGEYGGPFWWTLLSVILWTGITWYSARVVGYQKIKDRPDAPAIVQKLHTHFPRLMAFNATVCIQAAIWALPTVAGLDQCQLWAFVLTQNLFYWVWDGLPKRHRIGITVAALAVYSLTASALAVHYYPAPYAKHQYWLPQVALLLFAIELIVLWLFAIRRTRLREPATDATRVTVKVASQEINTPVWLPDDERPFFRWFNIVAAISIVLYILGFILPWLANRMGPLAIALLAFGIIVGLANIITVFSMHKRINFFFLLFILAIIVGTVSNPYQVRTHTFDEGITRARRPDLQTYFHRWLRERERLICDSAGLTACYPFPVYVVIADGGASRSGYWVSSVLSALQDESIRRDPNNKFSDHLLCLAGASGGSVGTATFYSLLRNNPREDSAYLKRSRSFLKEDFLSPVITHWLGSDFIQHFIPLGIGDRAQALEESMEYFDDPLDGVFGKPFTHVIDTTGHLPMLFINTTNVQQGAPAVVSSIDIDAFSQRLDVLDSLQPNEDLPYSTAVVLGARFPYVSPAGAIGNNYFVDGGYFDNTGAGIVHEMLQHMDSTFRKSPEDSALYKKLSINLIYLSNSSLERAAASGIHPLVNDAAAPILTVLGTYSSQTSVNNQRLVSFIKKLNAKNETLTVNLYTQGETVDYPMNWVISEYNLDRMNNRLHQVMIENECHAIVKDIESTHKR